MHFGKLPRSGLTLIEVTVGIALASTLLAGIMLASDRSTRQARAAQWKLEGIDAADSLLQEWFTEEGSVPCPGRGAFADRPTLQWKTERLQQLTLGQQAVEIIRLEVYRTKQGQEKLLAEVEFLNNVSQENSLGENVEGRENEP